MYEPWYYTIYYVLIFCHMIVILTQNRLQEHMHPSESVIVTYVSARKSCAIVMFLFVLVIKVCPSGCAVLLVLVAQ